MIHNIVRLVVADCWYVVDILHQCYGESKVYRDPRVSSSRLCLGRDRNEKKNTCQTSVDTHPVPMAEADGERVEIIATFYTAGACAEAAIFADSSKV
jgi:hypothetical protein